MYNTDAIPEYIKLFNIKSLKYEEYFKANGPIKLNYLEFLSVKKPCFILNLLSCPICSSVWLCGITCLFFSSLKYLGGEIACVWLLYFGLKKILNKFNE